MSLSDTPFTPTGYAVGPRQRNALGQYVRGIPGNPRGPGLNSPSVQKKLAELRAEYDPNNALSLIDQTRLLLAAKHLVIAAKSRNPNESVRSMHAAERMLSKIARPAEKPKTQSVDELLRASR